MEVPLVGIELADRGRGRRRDSEADREGGERGEMRKRGVMCIWRNARRGAVRASVTRATEWAHRSRAPTAQPSARGSGPPESIGWTVEETWWMTTSLARDSSGPTFSA